MPSGEGATLQTKHFVARSTGRLKGKGEKERVYRERCSHSAAFFCCRVLKPNGFEAEYWNTLQLMPGRFWGGGLSGRLWNKLGRLDVLSCCLRGYFGIKWGRLGFLLGRFGIVWVSWGACWLTFEIE